MNIDCKEEQIGFLIDRACTLDDIQSGIGGKYSLENLAESAIKRARIYALLSFVWDKSVEEEASILRKTFGNEDILNKILQYLRGRHEKL